MRRIQQGFTLIELMIVVAIVAFWRLSPSRPTRTTRPRKDHGRSFAGEFGEDSGRGHLDFAGTLVWPASSVRGESVHCDRVRCCGNGNYRHHYDYLQHRRWPMSTQTLTLTPSLVNGAPVTWVCLVGTPATNNRTCHRTAEAKSFFSLSNRAASSGPICLVCLSGHLKPADPGMWKPGSRIKQWRLHKLPHIGWTREHKFHRCGRRVRWPRADVDLPFLWSSIGTDGFALQRACFRIVSSARDPVCR